MERRLIDGAEAWLNNGGGNPGLTHTISEAAGFVDIYDWHISSHGQ